MRVREKDSDRYLMVPAWDFFGKTMNEFDHVVNGVTHGGVDGFVVDENNQVPDYDGVEPRSLLTINAIDGTIIDRGAGY